MSTFTFPGLLDSQLRADPSRPLVTFYDDATGERVELSALTYANWVSKTANLLQDELDVERGDVVLVDLPTHWLGAVCLGAALTVGATLSGDPKRLAGARAVVCGPDGVDRYTGSDAAVVALSLRPLGAKFAEALPEGVLDYGAVVLAQPDSFVPFDPPDAEDLAWLEEDASPTQRELLEAAAARPLVEPGGRLLTDVNPCTAAGSPTLLSPLAQGGGTVWVANPDPAGWDRRSAEERATTTLHTPIRLR